MSGHASYFANHAVVRRWPFTLYHGPLEQDLAATIAALQTDHRQLNVLVLGCGLFHERDLFSAKADLLLVDSDPRLAEPLASSFAGRSYEFAVCADDNALAKLLTARGRRYDLIICKEVIEHIPDPSGYLLTFHQALAPGGELWLSTPNYGDLALPLIEYTFLELIARLKGFSRFGIHPNKYSAARLTAALTTAGFPSVHVVKTRWRLALIARAKIAVAKSLAA